MLHKEQCIAIYINIVYTTFNITGCRLIISLITSLMICSYCIYSSVRHWCIWMERSVSHWNCTNTIISHVKSDWEVIEWLWGQLTRVMMWATARTPLLFWSCNMDWQAFRGKYDWQWMANLISLEYSGHIHIYIHDQVDTSIEMDHTTLHQIRKQDWTTLLGETKVATFSLFVSTSGSPKFHGYQNKSCVLILMFCFYIQRIPTHLLGFFVL